MAGSRSSNLFFSNTVRVRKIHSTPTASLSQNTLEETLPEVDAVSKLRQLKRKKEQALTSTKSTCLSKTADSTSIATSTSNPTNTTNTTTTTTSSASSDAPIEVNIPVEDDAPVSIRTVLDSKAQFNEAIDKILSHPMVQGHLPKNRQKFVSQVLNTTAEFYESIRVFEEHVDDNEKAQRYLMNLTIIAFSFSIELGDATALANRTAYLKKINRSLTQHTELKLEQILEEKQNESKGDWYMFLRNVLLEHVDKISCNFPTQAIKVIDSLTDKFSKKFDKALASAAAIAAASKKQPAKNVLSTTTSTSTSSTSSYKVRR